MLEKPLCWLGSSLGDIRGFPEDARRAAGYQLRRVQQGLMPSDWKPLRSIGAGVYEIRLHTGVEHRIFYVAKLEEAVYVLHAFEKRTGRTPQTEVVLARTRLADLARRRARKQEAS